MKLHARHVEYLWDAINGLLIGLVLAILLSGCASFGQDWVKTHPAAHKPWIYTVVEDTDITCHQVGSKFVGRVVGCATWSLGGCIIYLPKNAPEWLVRHEERHCEGWTHTE